VNRLARRAAKSRAKRPEIRDVIQVVIRLYEEGLQDESVLKINFTDDEIDSPEKENP
jgi:hypothetical protein